MVVIKIEYLKLGRCSELLKIGRYVVQDTVLQKGGIISLHLFTFTQDNKGTNNYWENDEVKNYIGKRAKIRWNKYLVISIFPEAGHFEEGNSLNLAVTVHNYPLMSYILQCCPLRDFGGKQFHLILDVMCPRSNQWKRALLGRHFQAYNNKYYTPHLSALITARLSKSIFFGHTFLAQFPYYHKWNR